MPVFAAPVVLAKSASSPFAVLALPVVLLKSADPPVAVITAALCVGKKRLGSSSSVGAANRVVLERTKTVCCIIDTRIIHQGTKTRSCVIDTGYGTESCAEIAVGDA
jgi:hypothetical protein